MSDEQLPQLPKAGDLIGGRFRITALIGSGGFGTVYGAVQENVGRDVALKFLAPSVAKDPVNIERFRREAFHVSQLRHPNTITLYDYGQTEDGLFYMVMELLEGIALSDTIQKEGAIEKGRAAHIFLQVLKSLSEAHQRGLVHRDLKPENIYLCEMFGELDYVKVLDFGVAKMTMMEDEDDGEDQLTKAGRIFGTPMYMAPEQACAEPITQATDIYALGLLLFEMLTGLPPVTGRNRMDVIHKQIRDEVPKLTKELRGTPLGDVIRRATRKKPEERYADASQMWEGFYDAMRQMKIIPAPRGASRPDISLVSIGVDPRATPQPTPAHAIDLPNPDETAKDGIEFSFPPPIPSRKKQTNIPLVSSATAISVSSGPSASPPPQAAAVPPPFKRPEPPEIPTAPPRTSSTRPPQAIDNMPEIPVAPVGVTPPSEDASEDRTIITSFEDVPSADVARSEPSNPGIQLPNREVSFIGRENELGQLYKLVGQSIQANSGHIILLEGESGVGKSRVVHALRQELFHANVGMCVGSFRRDNAPLETLREALADFWWMSNAPRATLEPAVRADLGSLGFPKDDLDFLIDFMRPPEGEGNGEGFENSEEASSMFARLERLFLELATLRPLTLVLEDIQHADSATLSFLEYFSVTLRTQATQIVVVLTLRSGARTVNPDLERSLRAMATNIGVGLSRVRLKRLRGRELSVLLDELLPMESRLKERVAWLSQGNPMHAMQIASYLQGTGNLQKGEQGRWKLKSGTPRDIDLPPDLMDLMDLRVQQAIERSPKRRYLRETVRWVATLGIRVPIELLAHVMGAEYNMSERELHKNVEVLRRYGILHTRDHQNVECVEFDNSLLRESLLREVSKDEALARKMHHRAAEAKIHYYQRHGQAVPLLEIAEHWRRAGESARYRDALFEAARASQRRSDPRGAREQFRELLRLLEENNNRGKMWGETLLALADLSWRFGELGLSEDNYRTVLEASILEGEQLGRAQRGMAHLLVVLGRYPEAVRFYRGGLSTSKAMNDSHGIAKALIGLSNVHLRQADPSAGEKVRERLEAMLETLKSPVIAGRVLLHLSEALKRQGKMRLQLDYLERALVKFQESGDRQWLSDTMMQLASALTLPGENSRARTARAEKLLKDALEYKRSIGDRHGVANVFYHLGNLARAQGDLEAAEHYLRQALRMHETLGALFFIGTSNNALAICRMFAQDFPGADRYFDEAIKYFDRVGDELAVSHAMLNKGTLAINMLEISTARALLEETRELKESLDSTWGLYDLYNHLAIVSMWEGNLEDAERLLQRTLEELSEAVADEDKASARSLLGLLYCFQSRLQQAALELGRSRADAEEMEEPALIAFCQGNAAFYAALTNTPSVYKKLIEDMSSYDMFYTLARQTWLELLERMARHTHTQENSRQSRRLMEIVAQMWGDLGFKVRETKLLGSLDA